MKKIDVFSITGGALTSFLGVCGGAVAQNYGAGIQGWIYFGVVFLSVAVSTLAVHQYAISYLRDKVLFVRKFSKNYIEGQWVQIIEDDRLATLPPTKFSFITIVHKDGRFKITGKSYNDIEGLQTTNFYSVTSQFDTISNTLDYVYKFTTDEHHSKKALFGETILVFDSYGKDKHLNKYKGVVHSNLRHDVRVIAIKVQGSQSYNFSNPTSREKAISSIREAFLC